MTTSLHGHKGMYGLRIIGEKATLAQNYNFKKQREKR